MNESKFTDAAIDCITDYVMSVKAKKEPAKAYECLVYMSEQLKFPINEVVHAFGDMVKTEMDRANSEPAEIDESVETFSKSLLTEAENIADTQARVDAAEKTQTTEKDINAQAADDKKTNTSRRYFAFVNFNKGQMYVCSESKDAGNIINKSLENLYNFLSTCEKPSFSNGILVAPITLEAAKQYLSANKGKIKYLDLTPEKKAEQGQQQQTK